jgi:DNA-binding transcriptional regulator YiaG
MPALPDAIRKHRRRNLMTQAEYAVHIGVSIGAVMGWEQGLRTPSLAHAKKLIGKGVDEAAVRDAVAGAESDVAA